MKRIYIAGKITGLDPEVTKIKFSNAVVEIQSIGFNVFNPFLHIQAMDMQNDPYNEIMKTCTNYLIKCDGILMLHDWKESKGAQIERIIANLLEIPIYYNIEDIK